MRRQRAGAAPTRAACYGRTALPNRGSRMRPRDRSQTRRCGGWPTLHRCSASTLPPGVSAYACRLATPSRFCRPTRSVAASTGCRLPVARRRQPAAQRSSNGGRKPVGATNPSKGTGRRATCTPVAGLPDSGAVSEVGSRFLASDEKLLMPRVRSFSLGDWAAASAFSASGEGASTVSNPTPESHTSSADTTTGGAGAGSPSSAITSDGWSPRSRRSPRNSSAGKRGDSLAHALPTHPHYCSPHTPHHVVPSTRSDTASA